MAFQCCFEIPLVLSYSMWSLKLNLLGCALRFVHNYEFADTYIYCCTANVHLLIRGDMRRAEVNSSLGLALQSIAPNPYTKPPHPPPFSNRHGNDY